MRGEAPGHIRICEGSRPIRRLRAAMARAIASIALRSSNAPENRRGARAGSAPSRAGPTHAACEVPTHGRSSATCPHAGKSSGARFCFEAPRALMATGACPAGRRSVVAAVTDSGPERTHPSSSNRLESAVRRARPVGGRHWLGVLLSAVCRHLGPQRLGGRARHGATDRAATSTRSIPTKRAPARAPVGGAPARRRGVVTKPRWPELLLRRPADATVRPAGARCEPWCTAWRRPADDASLEVRRSPVTAATPS